MELWCPNRWVKEEFDGLSVRNEKETNGIFQGNLNLKYIFVINITHYKWGHIILQLLHYTMQVDQGNPQTTLIKHFSLTQDQTLYINTLLPKSFVFIPILKHSKEIQGNLHRFKSLKKMECEDELLDLSKQHKEFDKSLSAIRKQRVKLAPPPAREERIIPKKIKVLQESVAPELRPCYRFLQTLKRHPCAEPFLEPVDPIALGIPTYFEKIKEPMDFGTIEQNLGSGTYQTQTQFHADIGKVFMNSLRFNAKGSDVYQITQQIEDFYNKLVQNPDYPVPERPKPLYPSQTRSFEMPKKPVVKRMFQADMNKNLKKKRPMQPVSYNAMTIVEKKVLGQNIRRLPRDSLKGVWEIVCNGKTADQQLKFDLETLPVHVVRQLQTYVNSQLQQNYKGQFTVKESVQTSATCKQKFVESEDAESFMVSQQSN